MSKILRKRKLGKKLKMGMILKIMMQMMVKKMLIGIPPYLPE